ncbi:MAG: hypothetical protein PVJ15_02075 [Gammaproteobacteria bacterium]|jgi:hypothetical protein
MRHNIGMTVASARMTPENKRMPIQCAYRCKKQNLAFKTLPDSADAVVAENLLMMQQLVYGEFVIFT